MSGLSLAAAVAFVTCVATGKRIDASASTSIADKYVETASSAEFDAFLDRLMSAESGGLAHAKNPRSTALGPFQFIKSTFLEITRRHFQADIAGFSETQILARRTDHDLSRRAAAVFCKDSVRYLKEQGLEPPSLTSGSLTCSGLLMRHVSCKLKNKRLWSGFSRRPSSRPILSCAGCRLETF